MGRVMLPVSKKIAFLGDYLPRKCGVATFATLSLDAVLAAMK